MSYLKFYTFSFDDAIMPLYFIGNGLTPSLPNSPTEWWEGLLEKNNVNFYDARRSKILLWIMIIPFIFLAAYVLFVAVTFVLTVIDDTFLSKDFKKNVTALDSFYDSPAGRDEQRRNDITYISKNLSELYAMNSSYPTLEQINDTKWLKMNTTTLNIHMTDPLGEPQFVAEPQANAYSYKVLPSNCTGTATLPCLSYTLTATPEVAPAGSDGFVVSKSQEQ
jgi:hypothetical protein